jgi:hypothetical protein
MPPQHTSLALSLLLFALSLITFITSVKYTEWAASSMKAAGSALYVSSVAFSRCLLLTDQNRPIIFYSGTIPILSLIHTTLEIACIHLSVYLPLSFILILAATGSIAWLVQVSVWITCELSGGLPAPGKIVTTPQWCPQFSFTNHGGDLSTAITIFKITLAWAMVVAYLAMAVMNFLKMRQLSRGKRLDEFHELVEIQPLTPRRAKPRPYSSTIRLPAADNAPAIQVLPVSNRP